MAFPRILAVIVAVLGLACPALAAGAFLAEVEDLPLAPGLTEQPGGTLFDAPGGRIIEATAEGPVTAPQVRAFYAQALPQLGWEKTGDSSFRRDNELLRIDIDERRRPVAVHFSLVPR